MERSETKTIYAAWCGTGKSYLCNKYPEVFQEIEDYSYRQDASFPDNIIKEINDKVDKARYLFVATDPVILRALNELGYNIRLYYPEKELRNEYLDRYIQRDSPYDFIGTFMKNWNNWLDELKKQTYCQHIVLKKGEYLEECLYGETIEPQSADAINLIPVNKVEFLAVYQIMYDFLQSHGGVYAIHEPRELVVGIIQTINELRKPILTNMSKNLLQEFFQSSSDANEFLEAEQQEKLENDFQKWFESREASSENQNANNGKE